MDSRSPRDGRVIEELGWYDPNAKDPDKQLSLKRERIEYWLSVGAQPSETVRDLLVKQGVAVNN
jgi:small subunit ribosomal protein S16